MISMETGTQPDAMEEKEKEKKERMIARRKRVEAKLEAKRKAEAGEEPQEVVEEDADPEKERKSWKQIEKSTLRLDKLTTDGSELVSNVVVAEDAREVQCRQEQEEAHKARYEKLEAEALAGDERFEEIMKKWDADHGSSIPQDLQQLLQQQKAACDAMTDEKDKLANEFQQELKLQDDQYVKYLKKQAEEVDLILERMEEQAHTLLKAHRQEMEQIESSFATEREALRDSHKAEWEEGMAKRQSQEASFLARREDRIDENEAQLQHLRRRNMEDFNKIKIKLETDIQTLEQQIQQMKATFLLNGEKLEYNFQVLKKRDEENTATISQQKRRITRLQDTLNQPNTKLRKQTKSQQSELQALMEEYRKNTEQYRDIQKKAKHFQMSDVRLFQDVWMMNEEKVRDMARQVMQADRVIHTQQLGLDFVEPQEVPSPMERAMVTVKSKLSQATIYASQVLSQKEECGVTVDTHLAEEGEEREEVGREGDREAEERVQVSRPDTMSGKVYPPTTVKRVLELLCAEAGFLLDDKLTRLVAPLGKEEQMMMKLDSMFKSLSIHTEGDIQNLVRYFISEGVEGGERKKEEAGREEEIKEKDASNTQGGELTKEGPATTEKIILIHPNDISLAIRRFIEQRKMTTKPPPLSTSALGLSSAELLDGSFWQQMTEVLPQSHERVWGALLEGLEQYHSVLVSRSKCHTETQALSTQNNELRTLLQQYMHSRINEELEVPPTLMLPA